MYSILRPTLLVLQCNAYHVGVGVAIFFAYTTAKPDQQRCQSHPSSHGSLGTDIQNSHSTANATPGKLKKFWSVVSLSLVLFSR
ncbi:hypothetical protein C8R47DRAFT_1099966 [Mycena vitilis]|nr:hypothetical protein C8R47DRAFT_1099966 [Mycena vitilis]